MSDLSEFETEFGIWGGGSPLAPEGGSVLQRQSVDVSPPIACHGGTRGSLFGLRRMQNSMVNARDSRFILVRALDRGRVIALRPVGVSLCVVLIVFCCVVTVVLLSRNSALLYIVRRSES